MKKSPSPAVVSVIGAGKMGLPIACKLASAGARVIACDRDAELVGRIERAECPFDEPGLAELLSQCVRNGHLTATTDTAGAVSLSDAVIVIVPVLLTPERDADLSMIDEVTVVVGENLRRGALVVYETTLPVGTTRALGEKLATHGAGVPGRDFHLAFSPERVKSRHVLERLGETPKVVGGLTPGCAARAAQFYRTHLGAPVVDVGSLEAAEFAKLADMAYRDVNIALANELAAYAERAGVDFHRVRDAANTSGESHLLLPGIGVGGHCTPIYPWFLIGDAKSRGVELRLVGGGRATNDAQPGAVIDRLEREWGSVEGRRVLILGLGFRPEVKEHVASPAFALRDRLAKSDVRLHDPLYSGDEIRRHGFAAAENPEDGWAEVLVLQTAHSAYAQQDWAAWKRRGLEAIVDGRNLWNADEVRAAGLYCQGVGR